MVGQVPGPTVPPECIGLVECGQSPCAEGFRAGVPARHRRKIALHCQQNGYRAGAGDVEMVTHSVRFAAFGEDAAPGHEACAIGTRNGP